MINSTSAALSDSSSGHNQVLKRVTIAWILGLFAIALAGWVGEYCRSIGVEGQWSFALQALTMSGLVIPGLWFMRKKLDRGLPKSIGVGSFRKAVLTFLLGIGLIVVPLIISLSLAGVFEWGIISFNLESSLVLPLLAGIAIVFFFEALPEELIFRGYVFSNLNTRYKRWLSALLTISLFVLLPLILVPIQKYVLGMDVYIGGSDALTPGYLINMVFFGAFVQYLRILTASIWTGIGFHLVFVFMNQLIGLEPSNLIQISEFESEVPMQISLISSIGLIFLGLILYPILTKKKLGWKRIDA